MRWLLLPIIVAGCALNGSNASGAADPHFYRKWPVRGPMLRVTNATAEARTIAVRDGMGRELVTARLHPGKSLCFRWPFIDFQGSMTAASSRSATIGTGGFKPWDADGWEWRLGDEPVANHRVCR